MRSHFTFSLGALALARVALATPFDDADLDFPNADLTVESIDDNDVAIAGEATQADMLDATDAALSARAYPTSFSPFPTDNAGYAAMTKSQHSRWCKTAKMTAPGYSRACIDSIWDSLYRRTNALEDDQVSATAVDPSSPATIQVAEHEISRT